MQVKVQVKVAIDTAGNYVAIGTNGPEEMMNHEEFALQSLEAHPGHSGQPAALANVYALVQVPTVPDVIGTVEPS